MSWNSSTRIRSADSLERLADGGRLAGDEVAGEEEQVVVVDPAPGPLHPVVGGPGADGEPGEADAVDGGRAEVASSQSRPAATFLATSRTSSKPPLIAS